MAEKVTIGNCELWHGDCREVLPLLPRFDMVLTDPPFGIGNFVQTTGRLMGRGDGVGKAVEWNDAPPDEAVFALIREKSKHRVIWGANFFNCFEDEGGAIVWLKRQRMPNFSKADIASCTHFKKTETVEIPWTNFTVTHEAETDHPCERPVRLYEWCLNYMPKGQTVCDPFMGSGSCGVASVRMGRAFTGIERERRYFDAACERIDRALAQPRLFEDAKVGAGDTAVQGDMLLPANVWIGATIVNQEEADRDIPKLLDTPAAVRWLSRDP